MKSPVRLILGGRRSYGTGVMRLANYWRNCREIIRAQRNIALPGISYQYFAVLCCVAKTVQATLRSILNVNYFETLNC